MLAEHLVDTWNIHNRILAYLLDAIPAEAWGFDSGKIKEAKPHPAGFYGYFLAHE